MGSGGVTVLADASPAIRRHRSNWQDCVLICRKCTKKAKGGFGKKGRESLRAVLKDALKAGKGRAARLGLLEAPCFKLCPKRAVTVARGSIPGSLFAVPVRSETEAIVGGLGLERYSKDQPVV